MKKIKKLIVSLILLMTLSSSCFAQGYPVMDIANLLNAIEQVYATYQEITNMIEQVQNTYQQIEQAANQVLSMEWDDLSKLGENFNGMAENPFEVITGVHKSAQDITKAVNNRMNDWNRLADSLHAETISFGGVKVSVADLVGATDEKADKSLFYVDENGKPGGFLTHCWDTIESNAETIADGYEGELTYQQRRAIAKRYGMSPRNYAKHQYANYQLNNLVEEANVKGTTQAIAETTKEQMTKVAALQEMIKNTPEGSIKSSMEAAAMVEVQCLAEMQTMSTELQKIISMYSNYISATKMEAYQKRIDEMRAREKLEEDTSAPAFVDDDE